MQKIVFIVLLIVLGNSISYSQENILYKEFKDNFIEAFKGDEPTEFLAFSALEFSAKKVFNMQNKKFLAEAQKMYTENQSDSAIITILSADIIDSFFKAEFDKIVCPEMKVSKEGMDYYTNAVCTEMKLLSNQRKSNKTERDDVKNAISNVTNNEGHVSEMKKLFGVSHEYLDAEEISKCFTSKLIVICDSFRILSRQILIEDILRESKKRNNININEMMSNISSSLQHKTIEHLNFNFSDKKVFQEFKVNVGDMQQEIDELIASKENSYYAHKNADIITQTFMLQPNSSKPQIKFQIVYKIKEKLGETLITQTEFKKAKDIKNQKELIRRFKGNR